MLLLERARRPLLRLCVRPRLRVRPLSSTAAKPLLPPEAVALVAKERAELAHVGEALAGTGLLEESRVALVAEAAKRLDDLLVVTVVGDFNSGKSSLINGLLGGPFLEEGPVPTTDVIRQVRYGPAAAEERAESDVVRSITVPAEWLRHITLVDTPGTNAVFEGHAEISRGFIPRSDLVVFVASVDQPLTGTQKDFLERIHRWRRRVVLVLNKVDLARSDDELRTVVDFVSAQAKEVLREAPLVFTLSAKPPGGVVRSPNDQFDEFRAWVEGRLTDRRKIVLKLRGAVDVASRLVDEAGAALGERGRALEADLKVLARVGSDAAAFRGELEEDFRLQQERVDNILLRMLDAADAFVGDQFRLRNAPGLLRGEDLRRSFDRAIGAGVNEELRAHVARLVDWLAERQDRHAAAALALVPGETDRSVLAGGRRHDSTRRVDDAVRVTMGPDQRAELTRSLEESVRRALVQTAAVEAGALGVGGALLAASALDVTGVAGASALALAGLYLVPHRRTVFKERLRAAVEGMRADLRRAMEDHFVSEQDAAESRLRAALAPYARTVRVEERELDAKRAALDGATATLRLLSEEISSLGGAGPAEKVVEGARK